MIKTLIVVGVLLLLVIVILGIVLGAVGPSLVALLVVFPLKGQPVAGGGKPAIIAGALLLNGMWGLGVALLMRLFRGR